jgi:hypothetical protein
MCVCAFSTQFSRGGNAAGFARAALIQAQGEQNIRGFGSGGEDSGLTMLVFGAKYVVILTIEGACWLDTSAILKIITGVLFSDQRMMRRLCIWIDLPLLWIRLNTTLLLLLPWR